MSIQEIAKAIAPLKAKTLKAAINTFEKTKEDDKKKLEQRYQDLVIFVALQKFLGKLKEKDFKSVCDLIGVKEEKDRDSSQKKLEEALPEGVTGIVSKASEDLLKNFSITLGLEPSEKEDMIKQITDQVMLTGMENFLDKLTVAVLKSHAEEMSLAGNGKKEDLVVRLMVHIFELEPLFSNSESWDEAELEPLEIELETTQPEFKKNGKRRTKEDIQSTNIDIENQELKEQLASFQEKLENSEAEIQELKRQLNMIKDAIDSETENKSLNIEEQKETKENGNEVLKWLSSIQLSDLFPFFQNLGVRNLEFLKFVEESDFDGTNIKIIEKRILLHSIKKLKEDSTIKVLERNNKNT